MRRMLADVSDTAKHKKTTTTMQKTAGCVNGISVKLHLNQHQTNLFRAVE